MCAYILVAESLGHTAIPRIIGGNEYELNKQNSIESLTVHEEDTQPKYGH